MLKFFSIISSLLLLNVLAFSQSPKSDEFTFDKNKLKINFYGHATLMMDYNGIIIHIDPISKYANYDNQPKADIILVTHEHGDHLDADAISKITKPDTKIIVTQPVFDKLKKGTVLANGKNIDVKNIKIEAVPAYNTSKEKSQFHPKNRDNGYVLTFGTKKVYIAGDTEDIPEMANLKNIEIAFLPMNLPYTMTPEQVSNAAKMIKPKILYPYHFGDTDVSILEKLMKDNKTIELRIRDLK